MTIRENIERIRERMEAACLRAGRPAEEVSLMAVTKYVDTGRMAEAAAAGIALMGENHAQEVREKLNFYKQQGIAVHFIGQLQTNKIKYICNTVSCIQSVDREKLALALEAHAAKAQSVQSVLLQVNIGREPQKGGVLPEETEKLLEQILALPHLQVQGLMCVPPAGEPEKARAYFGALYTLREKLAAAYPQAELHTLSMGMSHDFEAAILEGSTLIRVGSAIFGSRNRL